MIKKNIRQRKEYLYKKNNEIKDKLVYAKKLKLKQALESIISIKKR
jgi:U3 small nucleolar ribonucleoprotein protein IMP4